MKLNLQILVLIIIGFYGDHFILILRFGRNSLTIFTHNHLGNSAHFLLKDSLMVNGFIHFYLYITRINIFVSCTISVILFLFGGTVNEQIQLFLFCFMSVGFLSALMIFHIRHNKQYYFYYNLGLSRKSLYLYSTSLNFLFYISLVYLYTFILL